MYEVVQIAFHERNIYTLRDSRISVLLRPKHHRWIYNLLIEKKAKNIILDGQYFIFRAKRNPSRKEMNYNGSFLNNMDGIDKGVLEEKVRHLDMLFYHLQFFASMYNIIYIGLLQFNVNLHLIKIVFFTIKIKGHERLIF